jgi:opacity protein-like surface antigen
VKAPPPPPAPIWTWSGVYIGAHIGGGWTERRFDEEDIDHRNRFFDDFDDRHNASGVVGGGQVGINWQFPGSNWVFGMEGDFSGTDIKRDDNRDLFQDNRRMDINMRVESKIDWLASVRGRLGFAPWERWLIYATGGGAFTRARFDVDIIDHNNLVDRNLMTASVSETRAGFVVGGGIEWAWGAFGLFGGGGGYGGGYGGGGFGPFGGCCWTARIEFLHYEFEGRDREMNFEAPDWWGKKVVRRDIIFRANERDFDVNVVRFGLNYKFGAPAAPVAARY